MTNYQPEIEEIQPFVLISREILGMFLNSLKPYLPTRFGYLNENISSFLNKITEYFDGIL